MLVNFSPVTKIFVLITQFPVILEWRPRPPEENHLQVVFHSLCQKGSRTQILINQYIKMAVLIHVVYQHNVVEIIIIIMLKTAFIHTNKQ